MSEFFREYGEARSHAQTKADRLGLDVAIRATKEHGRKGFSVHLASRNDSDYALAEIVKPAAGKEWKRNPIGYIYDIQGSSGRSYAGGTAFTLRGVRKKAEAVAREHPGQAIHVQITKDGRTLSSSYTLNSREGAAKRNPKKGSSHVFQLARLGAWIEAIGFKQATGGDWTVDSREAARIAEELRAKGVPQSAIDIEYDTAMARGRAKAVRGTQGSKRNPSAARPNPLGSSRAPVKLFSGWVRYFWPGSVMGASSRSRYFDSLAAARKWAASEKRALEREGWMVTSGVSDVSPRSNPRRNGRGISEAAARTTLTASIPAGAEVIQRGVRGPVGWIFRVVMPEGSILMANVGDHHDPYAVDVRQFRRNPTLSTGVRTPLMSDLRRVYEKSEPVVLRAARPVLDAIRRELGGTVGGMIDRAGFPMRGGYAYQQVIAPGGKPRFGARQMTAAYVEARRLGANIVLTDTLEAGISRVPAGGYRKNAGARRRRRS